MRKKSNFKLILSAILCFVTVGVLGALSHAVHADSEGKDAGISISPVSENFGLLEPGDSVSKKVTISNEADVEADYKIYATGYQVEGESYNSTYPDDGTYVKIAKWITFDTSEGTLAPGESKDITYTITVPSDASAGGQYATIMVEKQAKDADSSTVQVTTRVGMVVLAQIDGDIKRCSNIDQNNVPVFMVNPPISVSSVVENCGNVDLNLESVIRVYPLFSDEEVYTNEDKPEISTIFPETKRYSSVSWEGGPAFGIFKVEQALKLNGQENVVTHIMVICPVWVIVLVILFIGVTVFCLVARNRERKEACEKKEAEKKETGEK